MNLLNKIAGLSRLIVSTTRRASWQLFISIIAPVLEIHLSHFLSVIIIGDQMLWLNLLYDRLVILYLRLMILLNYLWLDLIFHSWYVYHFLRWLLDYTKLNDDSLDGSRRLCLWRQNILLLSLIALIVLGDSFGRRKGLWYHFILIEYQVQYAGRCVALLRPSCC